MPAFWRVSVIKRALVSVPLILLLAHLSPITSPSSSPPRVRHFHILHAETGAFIRRLENGDVLSFSHPISVTAIVSPSPSRSVTFLKPSFSVYRSAPYVLPLDISPGLAQVTAFADDARSTAWNVLFIWRPSLLNRKPPQPWQVQPRVPPEIEQVPIPTIGSTCRQNTPLAISASFRQIPYSGNVHGKLASCGCLDRLRIRIISYEEAQAPNVSSIPRTTVLSENVDSCRNPSMQTFGSAALRCHRQIAFVEGCAHHPGSRRPLCGTSSFFSIPAFKLRLPRLENLPPPILSLAPGDKPTVRYRISDPPLFGDPYIDFSSTRFQIAVEVSAPDGYVLGMSPWVTNKYIETRLPIRGRDGVTENDYNGARVLLRVADSHCTNGDGDPIEEEYITTILVNRSTSALKFQDKKLPQVDTLVYPPTVLMAHVMLSINAKNNGGGLRANGHETQLSYKWYGKDSESNYMAHAEWMPFRQQMGPILKIPYAECAFDDDSKYGKFHGMRRFRVLVCNTFGCVWSNEVKPSILAPKLSLRQLWHLQYCMVLNGSQCIYGASYRPCPDDFYFPSCYKTYPHVGYC